jgi:hypothetical protein
MDLPPALDNSVSRRGIWPACSARRAGLASTADEVPARRDNSPPSLAGPCPRAVPASTKPLTLRSRQSGHFYFG